MKKSLLLLSGIGLGAGLAYVLYQDRQAYHRAMAWMTHNSQPHGGLSRRPGNARGTLQQLARERLPHPWQRHTSHHPLALAPDMRWSTLVRPLVILLSFGLGAGLMYILDADRGRQRRARFWQAGTSSWRHLLTALRKTGRDLGNRTRGVLSETRRYRRSTTTPDDDVLIARVRSQMGHVISYPGTVDVNVHQGRVTLSGPIPADEVDKLLKTVRGVLGVHEVINRLESYDQTNGK